MTGHGTTRGDALITQSMGGDGITHWASAEDPQPVRSGARAGSRGDDYLPGGSPCSHGVGRAGVLASPEERRSPAPSRLERAQRSALLAERGARSTISHFAQLSSKRGGGRLRTCENDGSAQRNKDDWRQSTMAARRNPERGLGIEHTTLELWQSAVSSEDDRFLHFVCARGARCARDWPKEIAVRAHF
jgi:hypothetical protein